MGKKYFRRAAQMRTVFILIEGPTEEEFVNNSLSPYLTGFGLINIVPVRIETSVGYYGGDISYKRYKENVEKLLFSDPACIVTSLIDFYELRKDFPGFSDALAIASRPDRVKHIEQETSNDINNERLIPYIQLHEFEALLFSDIIGFQNWFPKYVTHFQYVINKFKNPELINDNPADTPSARIERIVGRRKYRKPLHGPLIALDIGMPVMVAKCPRFKNWIDILIAKATAP
jgi:hypothetical protein